MFPICLLLVDGRLAIARLFGVHRAFAGFPADAVPLDAYAAFHAEAVAACAVALFAFFNKGMAFAVIALFAFFAVRIAACAAFLVLACPVAAEFPIEICAFIFVRVTPWDFVAVADQHVLADNHIAIELINVAVDRVAAPIFDFPAVCGALETFVVFELEPQADV